MVQTTFKVKNKDTRTSSVTLLWTIFIVNFEHVSHLFLVFLLLTSKKFIFVEKVIHRVKYGVFSGPYFSAFGLNTEIYSVSLRIKFECGKVSLRIQSECGKIRTRNNCVLGHISRSV